MILIDVFWFKECCGIVCAVVAGVQMGISFCWGYGKVEIKGMVMSAIHRFSVDWMEIDPP